MKQKRQQSTLLVNIYSVFISYDIDIKSNYSHWAIWDSQGKRKFIYKQW